METNVKKERTQVVEIAQAAQAEPLQTAAGMELNFSFLADNLHLLPLLHRTNNYLETDNKGIYLGFTVEELDTFRNYTDVYAARFGKVYEQPNHSDADEVALEAARLVMVDQFETLIIAKLRGNPLWTKAGETALGFGEEHDYRSRLRSAKDHPDSRYNNDQPGRMKARFAPKNAARAKIPKGQLGVEIEISFDNRDGTVTVFRDIYTTASPIIKLPPECCNKNGMAKCRWWNKNPVKGVWSDSVPIYCLWKEVLDKG